MVSKTLYPFYRGKTSVRTEDGRCAECGWSNFEYSNGYEFSRDGVRGYRCMNCGAIKPERRPVATSA